MLDRCYTVRAESDKDIDKLKRFLCQKETDVINWGLDPMIIAPKIAVTVLKKCIICEELGTYFDKLVFLKTKYGKPFVKNDRGFEYSVSHTDGAAAFVVSTSALGVDIEKLRPVDLKIAKRFFCKAEQERIFASNDGQLRRFFEVWTRKEAYLKYLGVGLSKELASFDVYDLDVPIQTLAIDDFIISLCRNFAFLHDIIDVSCDELADMAEIYIKD